MITLKSCPVCNSRNILQHSFALGPEIIYPIMPDSEVSAAILSTYWACQNCALIFQNPRLTEGELDKFYSQGYYRRMAYGANEEKHQFEARRAKVDAEIIKLYMEKVSSHLDIGCGRGYLLEAMGAKVKVGVQRDVAYVKVEGVKVYSSISQVAQKSFDLVTASHVLEHVAKPLNFLKTMVKFMKNDGFAVIEVPVGDRTREFVHLHYFEPDVLRLMCKEVGLEVIHTEFTPHLLLICRPGN